jgi:galactose mutarotase-like enzyme
MKNSVTIDRSVRYGIETFRLENELLSADILAGKGGDLTSLTYKPRNIDVLMKTPIGISQYEGRDLSKNPLAAYTELGTGGWADVLPGYAICGDVRVDAQNSGTAATIPWRCVSSGQKEYYGFVQLRVSLPNLPIDVEKTFTLETGTSKIHVAETIRNTGDTPIYFTWVQHSTFGGELLDGAEIELPSSKAFTGQLFDRQSGRPVFEWEHPVTALPLADGTTHDMTRPIPADKSGSFVVALRELEKPSFTLRNRSLDMTLNMEWDRRMFPYLRCWYINYKMPGHQVIRGCGLEPSNHFAGNFDDAFAMGSYSTLEPGQKIYTWLSCSIF